MSGCGTTYGARTAGAAVAKPVDNYEAVGGKAATNKIEEVWKANFSAEFLAEFKPTD